MVPKVEVDIWLSSIASVVLQHAVPGFDYVVNGVDGQKVLHLSCVVGGSGAVQDVLVVEDVWGKMLGVLFEVRNMLLGRLDQFFLELCSGELLAYWHKVFYA